MPFGTQVRAALFRAFSQALVTLSGTGAFFEQGYERGEIMTSTFFQRILLPGFILQSVLIGGGYATGRELVEFFLNSGPLGGLLGILLATAAFSLISALSFELARRFGSYSYRTFFKRLLGPGWIIYELAYAALGILVLAVVGAATGHLVAEHLGLDSTIGTLALIAAICLLVYWGNSLIEKVLAGWSFVLYAVYAIFFLMFLGEFGDGIGGKLFGGEASSDWALNAIKYVGYNIAALPLILFCVRHMNSQRDAFLAGAWAGPLAMLPALAFYIAMVAAPDGLGDAAVPSDAMLNQLAQPWLLALFYAVLFGTFVETGTAFVHAINERMAEVYRERGRVLPAWMRVGIAAMALILSIYLAQAIGLVGLIGGGYGTLTWVFVAVFILPLLTYGSYLIFVKKTDGRADTAPEAAD